MLPRLHVVFHIHAPSGRLTISCTTPQTLADAAGEVRHFTNRITAKLVTGVPTGWSFGP